MGTGEKYYPNSHWLQNIPSTPILPSPSVSPAFKNALVSPSVSTLASFLKTWRNSLEQRFAISLLWFSTAFVHVCHTVFLSIFLDYGLCILLQLIFLNEATLVLINDGKGLLQLINRFADESNLAEETLVAERVSSWKSKCYTINIISSLLNIVCCAIGQPCSH